MATRGRGKPPARRSIAAFRHPGTGGAGSATIAQSAAAAERAQEELNNATIRSPIKGMVLSRDLELAARFPPSSIWRDSHAGHGVGRYTRSFRSRQGRRSRYRSGSPGSTARIKVETFKERQFEGRVTQISHSASRRTTSPALKSKSRSTSFRRTEGKHVGQCRDRSCGAQGHADRPEKAVIYDAQRVAWIESAGTGTRTGREENKSRLDSVTEPAQRSSKG